MDNTPLLKQYFSIKAQYPEAVLLYRVGDFYECYSDDALLVSKVLGLVLTKKSNGDNEPTPMAGFPHHAVETYLQKLIRSGHKVAICDQLEDPKLSGNKLVKRGVTEILTPGIAFSDGMLNDRQNNFLAGLFFDGNACGAAFLDASTGTFKVAQGTPEYISTLIYSFNARELVVRRDKYREVSEKFKNFYVSTIDEWAFVQDTAKEKLCRQFGVRSLKGFGVDRYPLGLCAAGALLYYLEQTHHPNLGHICGISRIDEGKFVWMDRFTARNLEVFESTAGADGVSLVQTLDKSCSPMGARLLRSYLAMPIMDLQELERRFDTVQYFRDNNAALSEIRSLISEVGDIERILSRAATGKILPREMLQLGRSLQRMDPIKKLCEESGVPALVGKASEMHNCQSIRDEILSTMAENPAQAIGKGDIIADGVDKELDELRRISRGGKDLLLEMQQREIERTGISSLKINYNNVFGYYIEVRNIHKEKVPQEWIRKQTLVNAERYITAELKQYEEKIINAETDIYNIEVRLFGILLEHLRKRIRDIQDNGHIIAQLDVLQGFALQAYERNYCRPVIDDSNTLEIVQGRHPVIETLMEPGEEYVPNDLKLDSSGEQIMILTGPNMSGKSALLRQTALIVLMAQCGSFVPARQVRMGWFDKVFTRVGATDNISRGESTFMVEMLETSMIMHNLSPRSLVLLDEIGRGTSTYDGMSIARALVEYLHTRGKGAKTLFATHYHELNDLEEIYPRVRNYHISVKEEGRDIIFLRKLCPGGVAHSFGIQVARLAGMPAEIVASAERTLKALESGGPGVKLGAGLTDESMQMSIFQLDDPMLSSLRNRLSEADLVNMTPLQAFDLLRRMKEELGV